MKKLSRETYRILKPVAVILTILVVVLPAWYILATIVDQQNDLAFIVSILLTGTLSSLSWFILILEYFRSLENENKSVSSSSFIMFGILFFFLGVAIIVFAIIGMIHIL